MSEEMERFMERTGCVRLGCQVWDYEDYTILATRMRHRFSSGQDDEFVFGHRAASRLSANERLRQVADWIQRLHYEYLAERLSGLGTLE